MIGRDFRLQLEQERNTTEYLASFWNYEAVESIREMRESSEKHAFASDDQFEKELLDGTFKDNPLVDQAPKSRHKNRNTNLEDKVSGQVSREDWRSRKVKAPTDLSALAKIIKDD